MRRAHRDHETDSLQPRELLRCHGPAVWAACRRIASDPEDAYQDAWEHVLGRLHLYDPAKGSQRAWILTLTHRRLIDRHRRRKVRGDTVAAVDIACEAPPADELASRRQRQLHLERALGNLPEHQRRLVVMHHVHGVPLQDIAATEGLPIGTVKSRLHRARTLLASQLTRLT